MKALLVAAGFGWLALFVEGSLLPYLPTAGVRLDLIFLLVIYFSFFVEVEKGLLAVLALGLMTDLAATPVPGLMTAVYLTVYLATRLVVGQLHFEGRWALLSWVFLLTLAARGLELGYGSWVGLEQPFRQQLLWTALPQGALNAALGWWLFPWFEKRLGFLEG